MVDGDVTLHFSKAMKKSIRVMIPYLPSVVFFSFLALEEGFQGYDASCSSKREKFTLDEYASAWTSRLRNLHTGRRSHRGSAGSGGRQPG